MKLREEDGGTLYTNKYGNKHQDLDRRDEVAQARERAYLESQERARVDAYWEAKGRASYLNTMVLQATDPNMKRIYGGMYKEQMDEVRGLMKALPSEENSLLKRKAQLDVDTGTIDLNTKRMMYGLQDKLLNGTPQEQQDAATKLKFLGGIGKEGKSGKDDMLLDPNEGANFMKSMMGGDEVKAGQAMRFIQAARAEEAKKLLVNGDPASAKKIMEAPFTQTELSKAATDYMTTQVDTPWYTPESGTLWGTTAGGILGTAGALATKRFAGLKPALGVLAGGVGAGAAGGYGYDVTHKPNVPTPQEGVPQFKGKDSLGVHFQNGKFVPWNELDPQSAAYYNSIGG